MRRLVPLVLFFVLWVPCAHAWTWPITGPVLQGFSFDPAHPYASGQHRGIDIGASATAIPVLAPASGVVSYAGTVPTSGKSVTIETADGLSVTLTHLGSYSVKKNDTVTEGDALGTVGPSGTPDFDQPYLHLGIRTTAAEQGYLDPLGFLPSLAPPPAPPAPAPVPPPAPVVEAPPPVVVQPPAPVDLTPPSPAPAPVEQAPAPQPEPAPAQVPTPAPAVAPPVETPPAPVAEVPPPEPEPAPVAPVEDPGPDLVLRPVAISIPVATAVPLRRPQPGFNQVADVRDNAPAVASHPRVHFPELARPRRPELPVARAYDARVIKHVPLLVFGLVAAAVALVAALMIVKWLEGAGSDELAAEDPRRGRVAVRERPETSGPRRRPGRAVRHLRPLPPVERQRRPEGERDGRARHAGDGVRRPGGRVAA